MGRPGFWDSDCQRVKGKYYFDHHLDMDKDSPEDKKNVRSYLRKKEGRDTNGNFNVKNRSNKKGFPKKDIRDRRKKIPKDEEDKPVPTKKHWNGHHWNPKKKKWIYWKGKWFNPISQKYEVMEPLLYFYYWYMEFIWNDTNFAVPLPLGETHQEWCIKIEFGKRIIFECPRDHFKTSLLNIGYIILHVCERWKIAIKGLWNISWDKGLADETFSAIIENLKYNPKILSFYGYLLDDDRSQTKEKTYFIYQPKGSKVGLKCLAFKSGGITGGHPGLIMLDDIEDEELSPKLMRKFVKVMSKKLLPAVGIDGRIIVTGTIKGWNDDNDIYIRLEKNPTWIVYKYPAANKMPRMKDVFYEKRTRPILNPLTNKPLIINGNPIEEPYFYVKILVDRTQFVTLYPERYSIEDLVVKRLELQDKGKSDDTFWSEYFLRASNPLGKFFKILRIRKEVPPGFVSWRVFKEYCKDKNHNICLWIDPGGGGKGGHGLAIVVGAQVLGKFYLFDCTVVRAGLPVVSKVIGDLMIEWEVDVWGCEGNFDQEEVYGHTLDRELIRYLQSIDRMDVYSGPEILPSRGDKYLRIQQHISNMIGLEGTPFQLWVNIDAKDIERFNMEAESFGLDMKGDDHQFDLLDGFGAMKTHLFPITGAVGI